MSITLPLHRAVQCRPQAVATRCAERFRTYGELHGRVARLASAIRAAGVHPGDRVAILAQNSDGYAEALLAIAWSGCIFNPLNTRLSLDELAYAMLDSGSVALVVDHVHQANAHALKDRCPSLSALFFIGHGVTPESMLSVEALIAQAEAMDDVNAAPADVAGLFYTGGTTGSPKGVMLSHSNMMTSALGTLAGGEFLTPKGVVLHVAPLFHLAGIWPWLAQLILGGESVFLEAFDPTKLATEIRAREVTDVLLVPIMIGALVAHLAATGTSLPSLRRIIYAGSSIPEALLNEAERVLPGIRLLQGYGMTELAPVASLLWPEDHVGDRRRSAGRAAPHAALRVVDIDDAELPRGCVGEIVVRGGQVMLGYWNQPALTASALRGGWMHTGDAGYMDDDGFVYVVDRIKDVIISGGENVYSAEVENVIARHPSVGSCAVIGLPDATYGERVHAVVVLKSEATLAADELRDFVGCHIARYKAPRSIEIVASLPVSAAGKILKRKLRDAHAQRARELPHG